MPTWTYVSKVARYNYDETGPLYDNNPSVLGGIGKPSNCKVDIKCFHGPDTSDINIDFRYKITSITMYIAIKI